MFDVNVEPEDIRNYYNSNYTYEKYQNFLKTVNDELPTPIGFRLAGSPLFLTNDFRDRLINAGNQIIDFIIRPDFKQITEKAIPDKWYCANENTHPHMINIDFGVCKDIDGNIVPKLIELQGFPSVHGLQAFHGDAYRSNFAIPHNWTTFFNGLDQTRYVSLLKEIIIGPYHPDEVVLMDVHPHQQHTAVDFYFTQKYLNLSIIDYSDLRQEGRQLFYEREGQRKLIKRIYNRLVFDEIADDPDVFKNNVDIRQDLDVEWISHPNWYYRISKFILPLLEGECVLKAYYLNEIIDKIPDDLENYVLKPLFSFGGRGVMMDVTKDDIAKIKDPQNWILQKKIEYKPVLKVDDALIKAEIRLMYLWPDDEKKPILTTTGLRLTNGKMINSQMNKNSHWCGGSILFIQK